jgi:hypothetical protein
MDDEPIAAALDKDHRKSCWDRNGFAFPDRREIIEPGHEHGPIAQYPRAVIANYDLVSASGQSLEIVADRLASFGDGWAHRPEQDSVRCIKLYNGLGIVGVECRSPPVDDRVRVLGSPADAEIGPSSSMIAITDANRAIASLPS